MKIKLCLFFTLALLLAAFACNRKSNFEDVKLADNCYVEYDMGPCRMAVPKYYYDQKEKKCKKFTYGGCKGVVPFESLKECQQACKCSIEEKDNN